jgi:hypothetical protein
LEQIYEILEKDQNASYHDEALWGIVTWCNHIGLRALKEKEYSHQRDTLQFKVPMM